MKAYFDGSKNALQIDYKIVAPLKYTYKDLNFGTISLGSADFIFGSKIVELRKYKTLFSSDTIVFDQTNIAPKM